MSYRVILCYDKKRIQLLFTKMKDGASMLVEQRYREILNLMKETGSITTSTLKKKLDVSSETVRRDLDNMESQGLLQRTHGGAILLEQDSRESIISSNIYEPFHQRGGQNIKSKIEVAELAAQYIEEGQSVALDSGTTSYELARVLKRKFHSLTVVTNSLAIANELSDAHGITLVLTGGIFKPDEAAFTSDIATLIFAKIRINTFFLTTCGISVEHGVTYQRVDEIEVQDKMMECSDKTIVIADSSKLGVNSLIKMCDVNRISQIITDSCATKRQMAPFEAAHIPIVRP